MDEQVTPTSPSTPAVAPAVSPTGAPTLSQNFIRIAGPVVAFIALIGFAPDAVQKAGVDMPPLPTVGLAIIAWCKVIAVLAAGYLGINSQGKRTLTMLLFVCTLGISSGCKTVDPILITADSMVATGKTFEATSTAINSLHAARALNEQQYLGWYTFAMRFKTSFHLARMLFDAAADGGDLQTQRAAGAILKGFNDELSSFAALAVQIHPDGGSE